MNQYEIAVVYHPDLEVDLAPAEAKVQKIVTDNGGKVVSEDNWGKRKLAYTIAKQDHGIYVFYTVELPGAAVAKVESLLNITDEVIRFLITRPDLKAIAKAEAAKAEKAEKAAARGDRADDDDETNKVTDFIREQRPPQYDDEVVSMPVQLNGKGGIVSNDMDAADEPIFRQAVEVVIEAGKASTSLLQRKLRIGYGKAARMIESMEEQGIIGQADGSRPREVLVRSIDEVFGGAPAATTPAAAEGDVYDDMPND